MNRSLEQKWKNSPKRLDRRNRRLRRNVVRPRSELAWNGTGIARRYEPERVFEAGLRNHHLANTAYPIAHRRTVWRYRQAAGGHARLLQDAFAAADRMSLYAHIPFCERRCAFCEYTVVEGHDDEQQERYLDALLHELDLYRQVLGPDRPVLAGFDIGGGTPAIVRPERIGELVSRVAGAFRLAEGFSISIETTPKIAAEHPERLAALRGCGIDRISMGLQMVNPRLLREYGRDLNRVGHNHRAVEHIRRAGFRRFNIDLMYGFARQNLVDFRDTLAYTIALDPEYITLYRMRYKGTRIAGEAAQVDLARVVAMYELAREMLLAAGYRANPGKNGFSRVAGDPGTSAYLTERVVRSTPYLGLGLGAQTFTNHLLAYNLGAATKRLTEYFQALSEDRLPIQDLYHLPFAEGMAKMVSVSFYFGEIQLEAFREKFGLRLEEVFPLEVAFLLDRGLMEYSRESLRLTAAGARVVNGVIALFYSPAVQEYLLEL